MTASAARVQPSTAGQQPGHDGRAHERPVFLAMLLIGAFTGVEVVGGIVSGSLALLSDAGHMAADLGALALAWTAIRIATRRPDLRRSYGYHRFQVLAGFVNGLALIAVTIVIAVEAARRLATPVEVLTGPMMVIAAIGLAVNVAAFTLLHRHRGHDLNLRAATLHVLADLLGSVAVLVAAVVIRLTGWTAADPILSLAFAAVIGYGALRLVRRAGHILLEGTPENVDPEALRGVLAAEVPEVADVHHVHIWSLTGERPVVTLHAVLSPGAEHDRALESLHRALERELGIAHATIQIEHGRCPDRP